MESIGFKEWAAVCEALGGGRQSIILRKGGIAEGRGGFSFKHHEFFLFPTWFHEQPQKVREGDHALLENNPSSITIKFWAKVELSRTVTSWKIAAALEPLHILQPDVVRERFDYDEAARLHPHLNPRPTKGEEEGGSAYGKAGLHVAFVKVFRVVPAWAFQNEKRYGGCRSWVKLPEAPPGLRFQPVLDDEEHQAHREEFLSILDTEAARS